MSLSNPPSRFPWGRASRTAVLVSGALGLLAITSFWTHWVSGALAGLLAGFAFAVTGTWGSAYMAADALRKDEEPTPRDVEARHLLAVLSQQRRLFLGTGLVVILILAFGATYAMGRPAPSWMRIGLMGFLAVATVPGIISMGLKGLKGDGIERTVFVESSSIAFFVTVALALGYSLLEFVGAPHINLIVVWTVGMGAWFVVSRTLHRRIS